MLILIQLEPLHSIIADLLELLLILQVNLPLNVYPLVRRRVQLMICIVPSLATLDDFDPRTRVFHWNRLLMLHRCPLDHCVRPLWRRLLQPGVLALDRCHVNDWLRVHFARKLLVDAGLGTVVVISLAGRAGDNVHLLDALFRWPLVWLELLWIGIEVLRWHHVLLGRRGVLLLLHAKGILSERILLILLVDHWSVHHGLLLLHSAICHGRCRINDGLLFHGIESLLLLHLLWVHHHLILLWRHGYHFWSLLNRVNRHLDSWRGLLHLVRNIWRNGLALGSRGLWLNH